MEFTVNWISVLGAAIVGMGLGALWYGPLFGNAWMRSLGMDPLTLMVVPRCASRYSSSRSSSPLAAPTRPRRSKTIGSRS